MTPSAVVIDASVASELVMGTARSRAARNHLGDEVLVGPQHLGIEVASVVRGWSLGGRISDERATQALVDFGSLGVIHIDVTRMLVEGWRLRHNLSAYDALYVVLARALGTTLLTFDEKLVRAAPDCAVVPVEG